MHSSQLASLLKLSCDLSLFSGMNTSACKLLNIYDNHAVDKGSIFVLHSNLSHSDASRRCAVPYAGGLESNPNGKQSAKKSFLCVSILLLLKSALADSTTTIWKEEASIPFPTAVPVFMVKHLCLLWKRLRHIARQSNTIYIYDAVKNSLNRVRELPTLSSHVYGHFSHGRCKTLHHRWICW